MLVTGLRLIVGKLSVGEKTNVERVSMEARHRLRIVVLTIFALLCRLQPASSADAQTNPTFSSELIFPLNEQHNHAPGIAELSDGSLLVSWYRGSGERRADDVMVLGARQQPNSQSWSQPFVMVDTPGFPDCNTCLMTDEKGRLWLFWPVIIANTWESCITRFRVSDQPTGDGCPVWNRDSMMLMKPDDFQEDALNELDRMIAGMKEPLTERQQAVIKQAKERLGDKLYQRLGWQPRCKPTVLPSGRILLPLYTDTFSISIMAVSDDHGESWYASKPLLGFGAIQPAVVRRNDGTLVAMMRENGYTGHIRISESKDDGISWGSVDTMELPNPGSGLDAVRLQNGHWALVCNDTTEGRNRLTVLVSTDEGRSWNRSRHLENQPEGSFHYPAIMQSKDGLIHVVYSYFSEGGKSMKHAKFDENWVQ